MFRSARGALSILAALALALAATLIAPVAPATAATSTGWVCDVDGGDTCAATGGGSGFSITWEVNLAGASDTCYLTRLDGTCLAARVVFGSPSFSYVTSASCTGGEEAWPTNDGSAVWQLFIPRSNATTVTCRIVGDSGADEISSWQAQFWHGNDGWEHAATIYHPEQVTRILSISDVTISPDAPTTADDPLTASVTVRNDTPDTLTNVTAGLSSTTPQVVTAGALSPPSVATLASGASTTFTAPLTAVAAGDASLSVTASATDGADTLTATPRTRTFHVAGNALAVAVTPSKASVELALDGNGVPIPATVPVDVAVTNTSSAAVDAVTLAPLALAPADPSDPSAGGRATVEPPNSAVSWATIAPGATVHTTRDVTFTDAAGVVATARVDTATETASASTAISATLPGVALTWAIDPRWDGTESTMITEPQQLNPASWGFTVRIGDGCGVGTVGQFALSIGGAAPTALTPTANLCEFHFTRPTLDPFTIDATRTVGERVVQTGSTAVAARDFVVAAVGDSLSSGEGLPASTWSSDQCHRSTDSGSGLAALRVENADPHTAVDYLSLACSGAATYEGLVAPYVGIEPGPLIASQLPELVRFASLRTIDSVVFSIGANDLQFGDVVKACLASPVNGCGPDTKLLDTGQSVGVLLSQKFGELPDSYATIDQYLRAAGVTGSQVIALTYPDSTHSDVPTPTGYCETTMTSSSWRYAHDAILVPLNQAVANAGARFGWRVVDGAEQAFLSHGYCAQNSWITTLTGSAVDEMALAGGFHPNAAGYQWYGQAIFSRLNAALYPGGSAASPSQNPVQAVQATGTISAGAVEAGGDVTVSGSGFAIGEPVSVELHSTPVLLTTLTAGPTSAVGATVRIPADTPPGQHALVLTGQRTGNTVSIPLTVVAPSATSGSGSGGGAGGAGGGASLGPSVGSGAGSASPLGASGRAATASDLAATGGGADGMLLTAAAAVLLVAGAVLRLLRRRGRPDRC